MALQALRAKLGSVRTSLASVGERQPLHRVALAVVVLLDVFVLVSIFDGLDAHVAQLATPREYVPEICRDAVVEREWTAATRLDRLTAVTHDREASPYPREEARAAVHPVCGPILGAIDAVGRDRDLVRLLELRRERGGEVQAVDAALVAAKAAYDTSLLEAAAGAGEGGPDVAAIRDAVRGKTAAANAARAQLAAAEAALDQAPAVAALWAKLRAVSEEDRLRLVADLRAATSWFPVKRLGMQLLFLGPLFALLYAWNAASLRRRRGVQALVSAHLLLVAAVPILLVTAEAVYEVLPKILLKRLVELLVALKLVAIWHYLVIALAVAAALLVVWLVQKKVFSRERLLERRVAKGLCQECGKPLPAGARACVSCGFVQLATCSRCGGLAHVYARHCRECGAALSPAPAAGSTASPA